MMQSRLLLIGLIGLLAISCNSAPEENKPAADTTASKATTKTTDEVRTNISYLNDFNALEQVFGNENWLIPGKKDSSYFYLSRLGNYEVNTYSYQLVKGDSAQVKQSKMEMDGKTIVWEFDQKKLAITGATATRIVAAITGTDSLYEFIRLDANRLQVSYPDNGKKILQKTLPFSLFLVRSRYDHAHGTRHAFDSVVRK